MLPGIERLDREGRRASGFGFSPQITKSSASQTYIERRWNDDLLKMRL